MNELKLVPPKSEWDVDPWATMIVRAARTDQFFQRKKRIPIQVVLDTFRVYATAGKPIDVRVEFNR